MEKIEIVYDNDLPVAYFIRADWSSGTTKFITPESDSMQLGMIVYGAGKSIVPHRHLLVSRTIQQTSECVIVRKGRCYVDIYNTDRLVIDTKEMCEGDMVLLVGGAHGFRMLEDTSLLEIKQGPYVGEMDKERFCSSESLE